MELTQTVANIAFYFFAVCALVSAWCVITSLNPVKAVLSLVMTFIASAGVWMTLQAEFLSLVLILVYVGAVMVLFLFVIMMLDVDIAALRGGMARYVPIGLLIILPLIVIMIWQVVSGFMPSVYPHTPVRQLVDYSNTAALGGALYSHFVYEFELAAVILLVAMVAAIGLAFRGRRGSRSQHPGKQVRVKATDRVRLVRMPVSKPKESK